MKEKSVIILQIEVNGISKVEMDLSKQGDRQHLAVVLYDLEKTKRLLLDEMMKRDSNNGFEFKAP